MEVQIPYRNKAVWKPGGCRIRSFCTLFVNRWHPFMGSLWILGFLTRCWGHLCACILNVFRYACPFLLISSYWLVSDSSFNLPVHLKCEVANEGRVTQFTFGGRWNWSNRHYLAHFLTFGLCWNSIWVLWIERFILLEQVWFPYHLDDSLAWFYCYNFQDLNSWVLWPLKTGTALKGTNFAFPRICAYVNIHPSFLLSHFLTTRIPQLRYIYILIGCGTKQRAKPATKITN